MAIRIPLAFLAGVLIYMIAMIMTTYNGVLSLILQPIMGAIITTISLIAVLIVGSPLLFQRLWTRWRMIGIGGLLIPAIGFLLCCVSWVPTLRINVIDPETHSAVQSFHPVLALLGWLITLFGIVYCPVVGIRGDKRWI